jgi:hypothetical protein
MSKMPDDYEEAQKWAAARVGQVVFRHAQTCKCEVCKNVEDKGLFIFDKTHAMYITDCAMEMGYRYADTKEELDQ